VSPTRIPASSIIASVISHWAPSIPSKTESAEGDVCFSQSSSDTRYRFSRTSQLPATLAPPRFPWNMMPQLYNS